MFRIIGVAIAACVLTVGVLVLPQAIAQKGSTHRIRGTGPESTWAAVRDQQARARAAAQAEGEKAWAAMLARPVTLGDLIVVEGKIDDALASLDRVEAKLRQIELSMP